MWLVQMSDATMARFHACAHVVSVYCRGWNFDSHETVVCCRCFMLVQLEHVERQSSRSYLVSHSVSHAESYKVIKHTIL